jgi:GAF domain-containing protein
MFELQIKQIDNGNVRGSESELLYVRESEHHNNSEKLIVKKSLDPKMSLQQFSGKLLSFLAVEKEISQAVFFIAEMKNGNPVLRLISAYAHHSPEDNDKTIEFGEGFPGQAAKDGKMVIINDIPEGYMSIESGLGKSSPVSLIIFPVKHNDKVLAVIELASFHKFTQKDEQFFEELSPAIAEQILLSVDKN